MAQMDPLARLVKDLAKLPGIGEKTASRLAFHVLRRPVEEIRSLASSLMAVKEKLILCSVCCTITEEDPCPICSDGRRDPGTVCVVEEINDLYAFERGKSYKGVYHVLHGALSPLDGVGPSDLKTEELAGRVRAGGVREVILATNPTVEGDATALYLTEALKPFEVTITRIARGVPVGGDIEYIDQATLSQALSDRKEVEP